MKNNCYYSISEYYHDTYNEKVYKLPIKLDLTCPNRDGSCSTGGCIFCSESGGSFENLPSEMSVTDQLEKNRSYIGSRYKASKFIAYFQNFSNTYMSLSKFKEVINACNKEYIVGISVSTRSDCVREDYLIFLEKFHKETGIDISFELGLQTANYKTLKLLNRGESLSDFIKASNLIKKYNFRICTHVIFPLPWDDMMDCIETAKIINALDIDEVKIHSLYIIKGTMLAKMYERNEFVMPSKEEYQIRVITFLRHLNNEISISRLVGRAPEEESLFCNWDTSWWLIRDEIIEKMTQNNFTQGDLIDKKQYEKMKED